MRKLSYLLIVALVALVGIGCDSGNDEQSDSEYFEGTWALTGVSDDSGNILASFAANFTSIVLVNDADGSFVLTVTPVEGDPIVLPGTYTVSEASKRLSLTATTPLGPANLVFDYAIESDNVVDLTTTGSTAVLLNTLFDGVDIEGQATITVTRQ